MDTTMKQTAERLAKEEREHLASKSNAEFKSLLKNEQIHIDQQYFHPKLQYIMESDGSTVMFEALEKDPANWESHDGLKLIREGVDIDWTSRAIDVSQHVHTEKTAIPGRNGLIDVSISRPLRSVRRSLPIILYFHGGGYLIGSAKALQPHAELLSYLCEAVVVNVDYRLAPEHKFPAQFEDAFDVYDWCLENGAKLEGDTTRICASGDSAGGTLSLNVARRQILSDGPPLNGLLLYYPMTDTSREYASYELFGEGFGLDNNFADTFVRLVYRTREDEAHEYLRPISWDRLGELPPTILATAGFDIIRDQGQILASKIREGGGEVWTRNYASLNHSFIKNAGVVDDAEDACYSTAAMLKRILDRFE